VTLPTTSSQNGSFVATIKENRSGCFRLDVLVLLGLEDLRPKEIAQNFACANIPFRKILSTRNKCGVV
tara:strand:- start:668 stop:871 length:204 start_codon:yes stop_codon:yes gene_type:complete